MVCLHFVRFLSFLIGTNSGTNWSIVTKGAGGVRYRVLLYVFKLVVASYIVFLQGQVKCLSSTAGQNERF